MVVPVCPCKDCAERKIVCHSKCIKYKKWRKALDIHNDIIAQQRRSQKRYEDAKFKGYEKSK